MYLQNLKTILRSNGFLFLCFLAVGFYVFIYFLLPKESIYPLTTTSLIGKVSSYKIDGNFFSFVVMDKEAVQVFYYFDSEEEKDEWLQKIEYGLEVRVHGTMELPSTATMPHAFNYQEYLYYKNIYRIFNADTIEIVGQNSWPNQIKSSLYRQIKKMPAQEYLIAFLLGNMNDLETEALRDNGITHLFAVSGMHISLLAVFLTKVLRKLGRKRDILICVFLFFYAFLVGFTPSVLRSVFMFYGVTLNEWGNLKLSKLRIFSFVFLFMLCLNPFYLMDLGFQYSFLICFTFFFMKPHSNKIVNLFLTSAVAFLASLPISAIHFYEVNVLSVIWNMLFIPYVTYILYPLCVLCLFVNFLTPVLTFFLNVFEWLNVGLQQITIGRVVIPYIFVGWWLLYYGGLLLFLKSAKKKYLGYLLLFLCAVKVSSKINFSYYVYFLDVGQGDAAVIIAPWQKEVLLIDTGGKMNYNTESWQVRKNKVKQASTIKTFLNALGIAHIDALILTHGDYDHAGNAFNLLEQMDIRNIVLNHNAYNSLEQEIAFSYGEKIRESYLPKSFKWDEYSFLMKDENAASLIYRVELFSSTFLFMGDATKAEEQKLLQEDIQSDVLKVGHHGSKTSSSISFLEKVHPDYAIISAGENNRYNHPSEEVLDNLETADIPYYITFQEKTIWFKVSKKGLEMYTLSSFS